MIRTVGAARIWSVLGDLSQSVWLGWLLDIMPQRSPSVDHAVAQAAPGV